MWCFLLEINVLSISLSFWVRSRLISCTLNRAYHSASMKKGRLCADRCNSIAAIYATYESCLSRPMTGHTPQKLPLFTRNLLHHRSTYAEFSPNASPFIIIHASVNVKTFFVFFHKNFQLFLYEREKIRKSKRLHIFQGESETFFGHFEAMKSPNTPLPC